MPVRSQRPSRRGPRAVAATCLLACLVLARSPAAAQAEPVFSPVATETCEQEVQQSATALSGHAVLDCIGRSAQDCMITPGGDTTVGMMECLGAELTYWDARLNAAYADRLATAQEQDAELQDLGSAAERIEGQLRAMQRAWIAFRDASCHYERAQWMGGTGGGPASVACHMNETARQALKLEGWWGE